MATSLLAIGGYLVIPTPGLSEAEGENVSLQSCTSQCHECGVKRGPLRDVCSHRPGGDCVGRVCIRVIVSGGGDKKEHSRGTLLCTNVN